MIQLLSIIFLIYLNSIFLLLVLARKHKKSKYSYKISTVLELRLRLIWIIGMLWFFYYTFLRRLSRITLVLDFNEVFKTINVIYQLIPWYNLIIVGWFVILLIGFFILLIIKIKNYFLKTLLSLFLYFYQRPWMLYLCTLNVRLKVKIVFGFRDLAEKYVPKFRHFAFSIWPKFFIHLEKFLFKFLLPYLIIFDAYCNFLVFHKLFIVLPWYYLYSITRGSYLLLNHFHNRENSAISDHFYKNKFKKPFNDKNNEQD